MEDCDRNMIIPNKGLREVIVKQCLECYKDTDTMKCAIWTMIDDFCSERM